MSHRYFPREAAVMGNESTPRHRRRRSSSVEPAPLYPLKDLKAQTPHPELPPPRAPLYYIPQKPKKKKKHGHKSTAPQRTSLDSLPPEIIFEILSHLSHEPPLRGKAKCHPFLVLSATSRAFSDLVESYCYHILQRQYIKHPLKFGIPSPPFLNRRVTTFRKAWIKYMMLKASAVRKARKQHGGGAGIRTSTSLRTLVLILDIIYLLLRIWNMIESLFIVARQVYRGLKRLWLHFQN